MVREGWKPSLREASCWRREVMKGGVGWRRRSFRSTLVTVQVAPSRPRSASSTRARFSRRKLLWSSFWPATSASRAAKRGGSPASSFRSEAELARGLLLEARGDEGRRRVAAALLPLDLGDRPGRTVETAQRLLDPRPVLEAEALVVELLARHLGQPRREARRLARLEP